MLKCNNSHLGCLWVNAGLGDRCLMSQTRVPTVERSFELTSPLTCVPRDDTPVLTASRKEHMSTSLDNTWWSVRTIQCECEVTSKRRDIESHSTKCPKLQIACSYPKVGCTFAWLREHMPIHVKEAIQDHQDKAIMALQQPHTVVVRSLEFSKKEDNHLAQPWILHLPQWFQGLHKCLPQE